MICKSKSRPTKLAECASSTSETITIEIKIMATNEDAENQTANTSNEETPLLVDQQIDQDLDQNGLQTPDHKKLESKNLTWYLWRLFWILVAALVLGVFIEGWINAGGDVDVS
jgi:uncharacterized membrane protein YraQ (UPF0718 family)